LGAAGGRGAKAAAVGAAGDKGIAEAIGVDWAGGGADKQQE